MRYVNRSAAAKAGERARIMVTKKFSSHELFFAAGLAIMVAAHVGWFP